MSNSPHWILTATGRRIDLACPRAADVAPLDLAWGLAQANRFGGHTLRPYSVAEHSLLVADLALRLYRLDVHGQLAALMHDAHEAYVGDLATPAKAVLGAHWRLFEDAHACVVRSAFGLHTASFVHKAAIKQCDLIALATERAALMPHHDAGAEPWPCLQGVEPVTWVDLMSPERRAMDWEDWRDRWLDECHALEYARNDAIFDRSAS